MNFRFRNVQIWISTFLRVGFTIMLESIFNVKSVFETKNSGGELFKSVFDSDSRKCF